MPTDFRLILKPEPLAARLRSSLHCFLMLQSMNIRARLSYALDTWLESALFMIQQLTGLMFLYVIFTRVRGVAGWTLPEVVFIYALLILSMSIYRLVFQGMRDTGYLVLSGAMDLLLTKPRNPLFMLTCMRSNTNGLGDLITGIALLILAGHHMDYVWTAARISQLVVFVLSGNLLMVAIMTAQAALCFPLVRFTVLHDLVMALREFCYYPITMYGWLIRVLLWTAVPLAFCSYVPAAVLLGKDDISAWWTLGPPLVAAACLSVAIALFHFGLRYYRSTGS